MGAYIGCQAMNTACFSWLHQSSADFGCYTV